MLLVEGYLDGDPVEVQTAVATHEDTIHGQQRALLLASGTAREPAVARDDAMPGQVVPLVG